MRVIGIARPCVGCFSNGRQCDSSASIGVATPSGASLYDGLTMNREALR